MRKQRRPDREELIIDNFAGGGGASTGIEMALGRSPDVAINHDPVALAMHQMNHPWTRHYPTDVFEIDPRVVTRNRPVGLAWFSPDCKHFSKAKGGAPVSKRIRGLAWVVIKWAIIARPRVIILENVEEFLTWGPVVDGKPCPLRKGKTFRLWVSKLRRLGYIVDHRELRACDYGAPTIRKRLFVIARCDGRPIVWPEPTHGKPGSADVLAGRKKPWRTAAEIIDWDLPCHSIFLTKEEGKAVGVIRPLAPNTMRRIFAGLKRYVIDNPKPFIVTVNHGESGGHRTASIDSPAKTVTARNGEAVVTPFTVPRYSERDGQQSRCGEVTEPLPTITSNANGAALVAPTISIAQQSGSNRSIEEPLHTVTASRKDQNTLAAAYLVKQNAVNKPLRAFTAGGGGHVTEVRAFLAKYYGDESNHQACDEPLHTVPTRDRFGIVTVAGVEFQIVDIGMRMLTPRELFRAQGFPEEYIIDFPIANGRGGLKPVPKDAQTRCVGNSVCPQLAAALVAANVPELRQTTVPGERQRELVGV